MEHKKGKQMNELAKQVLFSRLTELERSLEDMKSKVNTLIEGLDTLERAIKSHLYYGGKFGNTN